MPEAPRTLRVRQKEMARRNLVAAATSLFADRGYRDTSIDDIAAAAGTSRATVYSYFDSKERILDQLQDEMWQDIRASYAKFGDLTEWTDATIRGWVRLAVEDWERHNQRNRACVAVQQVTIDQRHERYHAEFVSTLMSNAKLWQRFSPERAERRASLLIRMTEAYLTTWLIRGWVVDRESSVETMADVWVDVLHAAGT
ncbi:TetR/AcrR family transcriptional regulator [Microbacterium sp. A84]|uniref:TetR/AcrR family transcriptional regulator n=1 Tax=Microbacterium sp. A84 TaxID=3450715 RepID=UPI003F4270EA